MNRRQSGWSETDARTFLDISEVAVPSRLEQMEIIWSLIPAKKRETFMAVELGCGEGLLSAGLLQRFPRSRVLAMDGSEVMLERARSRLHAFGQRAEVKAFDLWRQDWLVALPTPLRCVVSSLTIHHLDDDGKRRLFRALRDRLEPGGALLIADIVMPASDLVRSSLAAAWNELIRQQSLALTGSLKAFKSFQEGDWNFYALNEPDPGDTPSRLFDQLKWLEEAGFSTADCFWMRAGHAIYGGYR